MNQPQKNNKLKLQVSTLTIKTLETKATPASSIKFRCDEDTVCGSDIAKVAAVAYYSPAARFLETPL